MSNSIQPRATPPPSNSRLRRARAMARLEAPEKRLKFLLRKDILDLMSISASTLARKIDRKEFPPPVDVSRGLKGWPIEVYEAWRQSLLGRIYDQWLDK